MSPDRKSLAHDVAAITDGDDVVALLRSAGRRVVRVSLESIGADSPWRGVDARCAEMLNPGEGAPIWLIEARGADPPRDAVERALRQTARGSRHGAAAAVVIREDSVELGVAVANERRVEGARSARRLVDERAFDAWSALTGELDTPLALLRAYRLLRKRSVGAEFFRDIRRVVDEIAGGWTDGPDDAVDRHVLATTLLCRVMFLYFVQARGWLDGDSGYLAARLLDPEADALFADRVAPLFFEVLNRPPDDRPVGHRCPGIPYLNGGLFERVPLEVLHPSLGLPDPLVRSLVSVLEGYRFVEIERAADKVALDPAMLGTVFESLMCPEARGRSGTFYTPPALVDEVVEDAVRVVLERDLGADVARKLVSGGALDRTEARACRDALDALTLLDPAMGSGAFLVGGLHLLVRLRLHVTDETPEQAMRAVIEQNLYGVDVSETAVTIAGLRLWLALAAATERGGGPVEPLPNVAHRLRRGNALLGVSTFARVAGVEADGVLMAEMRAAGAAFAGAHGPDKALISAKLAELERRSALDTLERCTAAIRRRRAELVAAHGPDLFGHTPAWTSPHLRELAALDTREVELREELARAVRGTWTPSFDFAVHFAPELASGGFDVVVGNPPWVRLSKVPPEERARLKAAYTWVARAGTGRPFGAQPDLTVPFVQRGVDLLRAGGALGMVVPAKLLTTAYASALRAGVLALATPLRIRDLSESPLTHFGADVLPATLLLSKQTPSNGATVRVDDGDGRWRITTVDRLSLDGRSTGEWSVLGASSVDVFRRLSKLGRPLDGHFVVRLGVKTGANGVFVDKQIDTHKNIPVLKGGGVAPMLVTGTSTIIFAHDFETGDPLDESALDPVLRAHFDAHGDVLAARADAKVDDPPWKVFRVRPDALGHRVVWRDIGERLAAVYVPPVATGGPLALNTTYTVAVDSPGQGMRLAAWLCSAPARFVAAARAERALSGYRRFMAKNVGTVPIADGVVTGDGALDRLAVALADDPHDPALWDALDLVAVRMLGLDEDDLAAIRGEVDRLSLRSRDLRSVVWALQQ